ncbi:MAG: hypothetical protein ACLFOY_17510, partial [Desulfatibacillaceae bacterium]
PHRRETRRNAADRVFQQAIKADSPDGGKAETRPTTAMQDNSRQTEKSRFQLVWGILLALFGAGMFVRIPQVTPKIAEIDYFASAMPIVVFALYFVGFTLLGGGILKIYRYLRIGPDTGSDRE